MCTREQVSVKARDISSQPLELQVAVRSLMWKLGIECRFSATAILTLNSSVIFLAHNVEK